MSQVINNNNKENGRIPFGDIKNVQPSIQQQKKSIVAPPQQSQQQVSRVTIYKQEHSLELETALNRIKELEEELKLKNETIKKLEIEKDILVNSVDGNEKTNIRVNNNRIRKVQQLTMENTTLKERLEQVQYKNEKSDKTTIRLTNNRIRLIQKLKFENQQLRSQLENNSNNSNNVVQKQQIDVKTPSVTKPPIQPSPQQQQHHTIHQQHLINQKRIQSLNLDYEMDNEHPGEC